MTPVLSAPGIVLRPLTPGDAEALFEALSDTVVQTYRKDRPHTHVDETRRYIEATLTHSRAAWAITETGEMALGRMALRAPAPNLGEVGIVIRRSAQRRGFGAKSLLLAAQYARALGLTRLQAWVDCENAASLGLFEHAGFTRMDSAERTTWRGVRRQVLLAAELK